MSAEDKFADLVFTGLIVRDSLVSPKIVDNPATDDEIAFAELDDQDVMFIVQWAFSPQSGGVEGENVAKFRGKQEFNVATGNANEAHEAETVGTAAN